MSPNKPILRTDLPQYFVDMGYKVGAEIGVYKGTFTTRFCRVGLKMYAVDPWKAYVGAGESMDDQARQDFVYGHTQRALAPYPDAVIIRASSMDAVKKFSNESLDFVYIDANHTFRYIAEDLVEWTKKVRKGGTVSGHDYFDPKPEMNDSTYHVKPVVDAYVRAFGINDLYIIGDPHAPSWMFTKV